MSGLPLVCPVDLRHTPLDIWIQICGTPGFFDISFGWCPHLEGVSLANCLFYDPVLLLFLPGIECFGYSVLNSATFEVLAAFPFTMRTTSHVIDSRIFLGKVEA